MDNASLKPRVTRAIDILAKINQNRDELATELIFISSDLHRMDREDLSQVFTQIHHALMFGPGDLVFTQGVLQGLRVSLDDANEEQSSE